MAEQNDWWREVEEILEKGSLLRHPFYQAWTRGELRREDLAHYAGQYYQQESRFSRYVSAVHSSCPELAARQALLENLGHEESGPENHAELWLRFAESVGASRAEIAAAVPARETRDCVATFESLCRGEDWSAGVAALYAYEAQQPAVAATKIAGLTGHYGVREPRALRFFEVHREADVWHSGAEKKILLEQVAREPGRKAAVLGAVAKACGAMNVLLDGVCRERGIACHAMAN